MRQVARSVSKDMRKHVILTPCDSPGPAYDRVGFAALGPVSGDLFSRRRALRGSQTRGSGETR
ncbi:hypothetical protein HMPREF9056_01512 [Actinomyces sp. oral taxon 170 str. F0386]|nr:hypothetical protein HMPREF9056_01512 [Actinomyces sp. oral taxon 170 str. F0386]